MIREYRFQHILICYSSKFKKNAKGNKLKLWPHISSFWHALSLTLTKREIRNQKIGAK